MGIYKSYEKPGYYADFAFVVVAQLLGLFGIFYYHNHSTLLLWAILYNLFIQGPGITIGYHRGLAHRAFDFKNKWIERIFVTFGSLGMQRGPIYWSSIHRYHHKFSDTEQDPHNSRRGFWYSHIGWLNHVDLRYHMFRDPKGMSDNVKDIAKDPYYLWLDKYFFLPWLISLGLLFLLGGWPLLFWVGFVPFIYQYNVSFLVNSTSHRYGYRIYNGFAQGDETKNNWWVGLLALGEGWHNNHHAFPSSPKLGFFKWWELDLSYIYIWVLYRLRLVENLRIPNAQLIQASLPQTKTSMAQGPILS